MESSKSIGETEECQSSESGWTMYIGSPMRYTEDDNGDGEFDVKDEEKSYDLVVDDYGKDDDDSDDSMASDASSRPVDFSKIGDRKCFEENKVVESHGSQYKKPEDDVLVKKNKYESRKNKVRKSKNLCARN